MWVDKGLLVNATPRRQDDVILGTDHIRGGATVRSV
jgi:hypothetical protein